MKKLISIALAALMLAAMSTTAFAATLNSEETSGTTTIGFTVSPSYTVTIPSTVTLTYNEAADKFIGSGTVSTSAVRLGNTAKLSVTVEGDFTLSSAENATLVYTATVGTSETALASGDKVAEFVTGTTAQSVTLNFSAANPEFAGNYTDTLTFTISAPDIVTE